MQQEVIALALFPLYKILGYIMNTLPFTLILLPKTSFMYEQQCVWDGGISSIRLNEKNLTAIGSDLIICACGTDGASGTAHSTLLQLQLV